MRWTFIYISFTFSEPYIFGLICFQCMPMCWFKFICIGFSHSLIGMCYIYFACLYCLTQIPNLFSKYSKFCINISETISEEQRIFFPCVSLVSSSFLSIVIHFDKKRVFVAHNFFSSVISTVAINYDIVKCSNGNGISLAFVFGYFDIWFGWCCCCCCFSKFVKCRF